MDDLPDLQYHLRQLERLLEATLFDRDGAVEAPEAAVWLVREALEVSDEARAETLVASIERLAALHPERLLLTQAAGHARALVARDPTGLRRSSQLLTDPWAASSAAVDEALAWAEQGELDAAAAAAVEAEAALQRLQATEELARLHWRLRKFGVRRRHWSSGRRPVCGWESLTETEHLVADLVSEGLTNRQVAQRMFLSRHTVDFHLRHIFCKLGIASRVQLARVVLVGASPAGESPQ